MSGDAPPAAAEMSYQKFARSAPGKGKQSPTKIDYEPGTVYLYQFGRFPVIPSCSMYCFKVESWLRIAGVKYENIDPLLKTWGPNGKLPFVELDGEVIAESNVIIDELGHHFKKDFDAVLDERDRAISRAFCVMLEHHTSWIHRLWRYTHPAEFTALVDFDLKRLSTYKWVPKFILDFFVRRAMRKNVVNAKAHGIGLFTMEEANAAAQKDFKALNDLLGDNEYFFASKTPTILDVNVFANACQTLFAMPKEDPVKVFIENECHGLVKLVERIKANYWADWDQVCNDLELNPHIPKPVVEVPVEAKADTNGEAKPKADIAVADTDANPKEAEEVKASSDDNYVQFPPKSDV